MRFPRPSFAILLLTLPVASDAQWHAALSAGDRIEAVWRRPVIVALGNSVRATSDSLWMHHESASDTTAIAAASLRRLRVFRGRHREIRRYAFKGLMIGAAIGGTLGLALAAGDPEGAEYFDGPVGTAALIGALSAAPGLVIGALVGLVHERWEEVHLP